MSRKRIPAAGKSGTSRMKDARSVIRVISKDAKPLTDDLLDLHAGRPSPSGALRAAARGSGRPRPVLPFGDRLDAAVRQVAHPALARRAPARIRSAKKRNPTPCTRPATRARRAIMRPPFRTCPREARRRPLAVLLREVGLAPADHAHPLPLRGGRSARRAVRRRRAARAAAPGTSSVPAVTRIRS